MARVRARGDSCIRGKSLCTCRAVFVTARGAHETLNLLGFSDATAAGRHTPVTGHVRRGNRLIPPGGSASGPRSKARAGKRQTLELEFRAPWPARRIESGAPAPAVRTGARPPCSPDDLEARGVEIAPGSERKAVGSAGIRPPVGRLPTRVARHPAGRRRRPFCGLPDTDQGSGIRWSHPGPKRDGPSGAFDSSPILTNGCGYNVSENAA